MFDPKTIADRSTFSDPNELAVGMRWVLVNGVPVIAAGQMTGAQPGQVLRGARLSAGCCWGRNPSVIQPLT